MSLKPDPIQPVPEETARVARAVFRKGNPLLSLRDELGAIFEPTSALDPEMVKEVLDTMISLATSSTLIGYQCQSRRPVFLRAIGDRPSASVLASRASSARLTMPVYGCCSPSRLRKIANARS